MSKPATRALTRSSGVRRRRGRTTGAVGRKSSHTRSHGVSGGLFIQSTRDYIRERLDALTYEIVRQSPVEFCETNRYLSEAASAYPGYFDVSLVPYCREIIECFDIRSPVREVAWMKGAQCGYTTVLECGLLYAAGHLRTTPIMWITADLGLATGRVDNSIVPMLNQSGLDLIASSDTTSRRKTGKTKSLIQFKGGGFLVPYGAQRAESLRQWSIHYMLQDEIDGWPLTVGKDGDPVALSDSRCDAFWNQRKIFRGSTPTIKGVSQIEKYHARGDQRIYLVCCRKCNRPQELRWQSIDKTTGEMSGGFVWDYNEDGSLAIDSVRYRCIECGADHFEHHKRALLSEANGAHWKPTATPVEPGIRSYHLPAFYSPLAPWHKRVLKFLECFDVESQTVTDVPAYQVFRNNVLAKTFEIRGSRVTFRAVSGHRRAVYRSGEVPNEYARVHSGSPILLLTMTVDVHKDNLAVAVWGWCKDARSYLIDYWRIEPQGPERCDEIESTVWGEIHALIEQKTYTADDGAEYGIGVTLIDAGYANATVSAVCAEYDSNVYPILGRDKPERNQRISEFAPFKTQSGHVGYKVTVDHFKDRMAPVLRREWYEEHEQEQGPYHFNAPCTVTDRQLKELTRETRRERVNEKGEKTYFWFRPSNARNELFDCLIYGHASVEILAYSICIEHLELEKIDMGEFWKWLEDEAFFYTPPLEGRDLRIAEAAAEAEAARVGVA